jgi:hypothetical protein
MTAKFIQYGGLYFFLILVVSFSFKSCGTDDDDDIAIVEKTFLEKYDGTKWVITEEYEGYVYYLRINDNQRVPFEIWGRSWDLEKANEDETCYGHQDGYMDEDEGANSMEIVENSDNRFTIGGDGEFWCLEIRGETLKFGAWSVYGDADPNIWDNPDSMVFKKTTVNVDAFEICPDDYYE